MTSNICGSVNAEMDEFSVVMARPEPAIEITQDQWETTSFWGTSDGHVDQAGE